MKFRPMLDTLERREVPSVVTPDEPTTTPPPYMPPADGGQPPADGQLPPLNTPVPGDKPANPVDDNAEVKALRARLAVILNEVKALDKLRAEFVDRVASQMTAIFTAEKVVKNAETELASAKKALADFEKIHDAPFRWTQEQKQQHEALKTAIVKAEGKLDGATAGLEAQQQILANIKARIDAIDAKKKEYEQEETLINARIGVITNAISAGKEVPVGKAIPGTEALNPDQNFLRYWEPLKAAAPK